MVPVSSNGAWSCYIWDLKQRVVNIIDPTAGPIGDDFTLTLHSDAIGLLEQCIKYAVLKQFSGWDLGKADFLKKVVRVSDSPPTRYIPVLIYFPFIIYILPEFSREVKDVG